MKFEIARAIILSLLLGSCAGIASAVEAMDVKCSSTKFAMNFPADPSQVAIGRSLATIVTKSTKGIALPRWIFPLDAHFRLGFLINDSKCVIWKGSEWYVRDVFWPYRASDGNGFIAINLTKASAYFILGKDIALFQHELTHSFGPDPAVVEVLSEGYLAWAPPPESSSCYFVPDQAKCKR